MLAKSIKFQVLFALIFQIIALLGVVLTILYLINLRQHDYLILNLSGQLRVISRSMITQSEHYLEQAPRDYQSYHRDLGLYHQDLQKQVNSLDEIIQSLKLRTIKADLITQKLAQTPNKVPSLTTDSEPIICKWDAPSRQQMDRTASVWETFHAGLVKSLGQDQDGPRLEAAAEYIIENGNSLTQSAARLSDSFRAMMENKLTEIKILNQLGIGIIVVFSIFILFILFKQIFGPVDRTVLGFHRVANGDLDHQVPVDKDNEIGDMTNAFNYLTQRLSALFRLTDRINTANNLDETLRFAYEEFPKFLPVQWLALLRTGRRDEYYLQRYFSQQNHSLNENDSFEYINSLFAKVIETNKPFCSCINGEPVSDWQSDTFVKKMVENGFHSFFYLPLTSNPLETAVLVIATTDRNAYDASHVEFLTNIAGQIGHSFEKTIGMESLIVSTVKGLAKLAESRDPETGDHLFRMSHYSALIAEQMGKMPDYKSIINLQYIRDVLRFAPMHDIGKVGISDDILLKPGKLTDDEFSIMQQHPLIGGDVLRRCEKQMNAVGKSVFQIGIEIAEGHHEKFDGSGYPNKLQGNEIPLSARIVSVADVFDALTSKRPYKEAWPVDKALELLRSESGRHFDPAIVDAFHNALPKVIEIYDKHKHV